MITSDASTTPRPGTAPPSAPSPPHTAAVMQSLAAIAGLGVAVAAPGLAAGAAPYGGSTAAEARARLLGERLTATLRTAEALLQAGRRIDLRGLEGQAADFCNCLMALMPDQITVILPLLDGLLACLDRLQDAVAGSRVGARSSRASETE